MRVNAKKQRPLCQWPECEFFAVRELQAGLAMERVSLCPAHARQFHHGISRELRAVSWQPPRYARLNAHRPVPLDSFIKHEGAEFLY